ncbi:hypothetical protein TCON_1398 [Astathelohania contejeani]|uniref:DUF5096 domain-containing protein n=1 Tax=Astathelohania contejeani TaxID=164912 RepID=A0ABQ7HZ35_9MICR|nr:hypothetical protein TCON_1398 [Thelohania contejeani]
MNEFLETYILFETEKGTFQGRLKSVDEDNGIFVISTGGYNKQLNIKDIIRLEMIEDQPVFEDPAIIKTGKIVGRKSISKKEDINNITNNPNNDTKPKIISNEKNINNNENELTEYLITREYANRIFKQAFNLFGPSEDAFIAIASYNLIKLQLTLTLRDKIKEPIAIIISGDSTYARMGYYLARLLPTYGFEIDVFLMEKDVVGCKTIVYKQQFVNSGGLFSSKYRTYKIAIIAVENGKVDLSMLSSKMLIYLDIPEFVDESKKFEIIGTTYGFITNRAITFPGSVFLIDGGFSDFIYEHFNVRKFSKKGVIKIPLKGKLNL